MPGLSQSEWFTKQLMAHWPMLPYRATEEAVLKLTDEKYMELKRLYFQAFATSDKKQADAGARNALDVELIKMGLLN
jgi:hypothetical protein